MYVASRYDESEFAARLASQVLRDVFAYWQRRRGTRPMPARADIEPMDIPQLLPHVFIHDVIAAPRDYRARLLGTAIGERYGQDHTGKLIGDIFPEPTLSLVRRIFGTVVGERRPAHATGPVVWRHDEYSVFEAVFLPLADDAGNVNMIFGALVFGLRGPGPAPESITIS